MCLVLVIVISKLLGYQSDAMSYAIVGLFLRLGGDRRRITTYPTNYGISDPRMKDRFKGIGNHAEEFCSLQNLL